MKELSNISKIFKRSFVLSSSIKHLFICKNYVSKSLDEIGGAWYQSDTHKLVNELKKKVTDDNITLSTKFGLEVQNDFETLSIIH